MRISVFLSFATFFFVSLSLDAQPFISVKDGQFYLGDSPYKYCGTNFWYGMNLGAKGAGGDRERLLSELDKLSELGLTNLRIVAGSEGPDTEPYRMTPALQTAPGEYNDDQWLGLDFLLTEMAKRNMKAVVCLNNFWPWSGGFGQYLVWSGELDSIPYPPPHPGGTWGNYQRVACKFYQSEKAMAIFEDHIRTVVNRKNSLSGVDYKADPTIMSWELCNEPRGMHKMKSFQDWIEKTTGLIKSLDKNHLVTVGTEGSTPSPFYAGLNFEGNHDLPGVDYATIHIWIENFGWYNPEKPEETFESSLNLALEYLDYHVAIANEMEIPLVLEEFGIARDMRSHDPSSTTKWRDQYYSTLYERVEKHMKDNSSLCGSNFWAWGGEGRPITPYGSLWNHGDPFIGDPPHEHQGWYSVYDHDASTLKILQEHAKEVLK